MFSQTNVMLYESIDADIAAAGANFPPRTDRYRNNRIDPKLLQIIQKNLFDEHNFRSTLHDDCKFDQGQPPITFFSHSSPVVYSSSQSRYSISLQR